MRTRRRLVWLVLLATLSVLQFIPVVLERRAIEAEKALQARGRALVDEAVKADSARRTIGD
jgi:hypothetical protein